MNTEQQLSPADMTIQTVCQKETNDANIVSARAYLDMLLSLFPKAIVTTQHFYTYLSAFSCLHRAPLANLVFVTTDKQAHRLNAVYSIQARWPILDINTLPDPHATLLSSTILRDESWSWSELSCQPVMHKDGLTFAILREIDSQLTQLIGIVQPTFLTAIFAEILDIHQVSSLIMAYHLYLATCQVVGPAVSSNLVCRPLMPSEKLGTKLTNPQAIDALAWLAKRTRAISSTDKYTNLQLRLALALKPMEITYMLLATPTVLKERLKNLCWYAIAEQRCKVGLQNAASVSSDDIIQDNEVNDLDYDWEAGPC
jgi:hypothetical protein